ncbi:cell wall hydrolase [Bowmanella yangjiangensis]|uniref:Cell wall hydrolase n=1 Tax=Bowmanella yangjiangensis TaxID=2811230 RepID=A0ABS3D0U1_9ALTE|nr:cell wall hydrolase [Bowmanella yangjiangensis]MBN7822405.1 cell wall hydrolase [Bowmanella yangjiangensis]
MTQRERDIDVLARTIWGEARGEGRAGQIAVGWCIRNRVEMDLHNDGKPDWWGEGYEGVCKAPWQFSCWNLNDPNSAYLRGEKQIPSGQFMQCREAALAVIDGQEPDPTGAATHYYATTMKKPPAWVKGATRTRKIGRHIFFKDVP